MKIRVYEDENQNKFYLKDEIQGKLVYKVNVRDKNKEVNLDFIEQLMRLGHFNYVSFNKNNNRDWKPKID